MIVLYLQKILPGLFPPSFSLVDQRLLFPETIVSLTLLFPRLIDLKLCLASSLRIVFSNVFIFAFHLQYEMFPNLK